MADPVFEFARYRLSKYELRRGKRSVDLEPTPLAVLYFLVSNRSRVLSKSELQKAVWGADTHVSASAIDRAVSKIRMALDDDADAPTFVETMHRRGWRFIAKVRVSSDGTQQVEAEPGFPLGAPKAYDSDRSRFVRDVNFPDGSVVRVNQQFTKSWEIQNVGTVPWTGRFLTRQGPAEAVGRLKSAERVPVPTTLPGDSCVLSVDLQAPRTPGSCYAEWKITDDQGRHLLTRQFPIYLSVDVRE